MSVQAARIMVVDDTPANLKLLDEMLRERSYQVFTFPSAELALKALARNVPDLILLDINMPGMNGFQMCERLRADQATADIPVLFISAMTDTEAKVQAFGAGGLDYVTKPFQFDEVHARVETHLRLHRMKVELERHNRHLETLVEEKVREISDAQMATISALARLAESRDDDTGRHIERTRSYCKALAVKLCSMPRDAARIDSTFIDTLYQAAPLHDIGKVGIPDAILLKPGKLTEDEFEIMKTHTTIGARTLEAVRQQYPGNKFINMGIAVARSHHEKWDGGGYPEGLSGESIPLASRIMAIADVYDAVRSKRAYKQAVDHDETCAIIIQGSGGHFDPVAVEAFRLVASDFAEIRARFDDALTYAAR